MAFCKGCGERIEWWKTEAGKSMPVDPDPHPEGNVLIDVVRNVVKVVPVGSHPRLRRSHFVTCPKAGQFRKQNPKAVICEVADCALATPHRHCFECGSIDHLAEHCPDGG